MSNFWALLPVLKTLGRRQMNLSAQGSPATRGIRRPAIGKETARDLFDEIRPARQGSTYVKMDSRKSRCMLKRWKPLRLIRVN
eukprot:6186851-Pleurochrysis_carterae.AAC.9